MLRTHGSTKALRWKLENGGAVGEDELTPTSIPGARLRLCIYDSAASTQPLVAAGVASADGCGAKPCWRAVGSPAVAAGLRYRNKAGAPDGITDVRLRMRRGELTALVRAHGPALAMPPLGVGVPVRAQLVAGDPARLVCWQSVFATTLRNDATMVKATQHP